MNLLVKRSAVIAIVAGTGIWIAWHLTRDAEPKRAEKVSVTAPTKIHNIDAADGKTDPDALAPSISADQPSGKPTPSDVLTAEVRATRRMYGAHAPLRSPEVADPDSETNLQILQSMVEKSLSRQKTSR